MKEKIQRFVAITLVLASATLLLFGTTYTPAAAQAEDGILNDIGEGENRVLSTEWRILTPGQQITYQFVYDGEEQPISIWMNTVPADGAIFQIWTDERLEELSENAETEPLGQGTAMSEGSGFTNWQGGSPEAETYYVVVSAVGDTPARFLLNISSPALALEQPGALSLEPVATPALDPNVAVVTTELLNVRSGPSTAFAVLTTIPNGTQMTVLGRNATNTWINIQLEDGIEGWVTRSLTSYTRISPNVVAPAQLPVVAASVSATVTTTTSAPAAVTPVVTPTNLVEGWQVLGVGEVDWYVFQYRGGELPLTLWMDIEPFGNATFTVVDAATAQALMAGTTPATIGVVGRGRANPVEPSYLFWLADFAEADTFYVMVEPTDSAGGDVLYSLNALGPGVARVIEPVQ